MKQKTIRLSGDYYRLTSDGRVQVWHCSRNPNPADYHDDGDWEYVDTKYQIGAVCVLVGVSDVSPNALRSGNDTEYFSLRFDCQDGVPGNSNNNICRFHGWRGTTDNKSVYAYGERKIVKIRRLHNGDIAVTVGADLATDAE